jgi:uncharacterized membrane protein YsdA (DUF1294 family)
MNELVARYHWMLWVFAFTIVMSLVTFVTYGIDKARAGKAQRRIPERTLHLLALLGGWPGGLLGQQTFRHKTRKVSFQIGFWITVLLNLGAWWIAIRSGILEK